MATPADTTQKAPERKFIVFPVPGSEQQIVCSTDVLDSNKERDLGAFCAMVYSQFRGAVEKNPYKHTFSLTDGTTAYCKKDFRTGAYVQPTRYVIPTGKKPVCLSFN